jgi:hypothetical protein
MSSRFWLGVLLGCCLGIGAAGVSAQAPKLVVMDFSGDVGGKARAQVMRGLRDEASFEPRSEAKSVLETAGAAISSVEGRAAVAEQLSVDYVVWGRVRGRGSSSRAEVRIAGPQGRQITERSAGPPGQSKGNQRIRAAARAALAKAMQVAPPRGAKAQVEAVIVTPIEISLADEPEIPEKSEQRVESQKAQEAEKSEKKKPPRNRVQAGPILKILGGAGGRARKIDIQVDDGTSDSASRTYDSGVFLDIVFRLELRPWARHHNEWLRGLALEADGDFGVGLQTETPGSTAKLDTKTWRVLGQIGYLHGLGKHEIGGLIGIGFDALELEENGTLPSIRYLFLRLGPAYRYSFFERSLYLRVDGGFRLPFSYGDLEKTFGEATGFGFDAGLMLGGELEVGFSYLLRVSVEYFKPQFGGFPEGMLPGLPGAASGKDGTDLAINFNVALGWSF